MPDLIHHPHGITAIDTHYVRPLMDASHLVVHSGRAAFVDTGTSRSVPYLLAALDAVGIGRDAVDYVFITHVHLDHAGGAGQLMQALPRARAVLHPRAAPHMIDPGRLIEGSIAVYGESAYRTLYGELVAIDPQRILVTEDGTRIDLAGRSFEFLHTPGHALHHHSIVDHGANGIFSGDTFGISYRELDVDGRPMIIPTTTPTQFDPPQLLRSIDRLLGYRPRSMYLTHYSRVDDVARLGEALKRQIGEFVAIGTLHAGAAQRGSLIRADMRKLFFSEARAHGSRLNETDLDELLKGDLDLNTAGVIAWLDRQNKH